MECRHDKLSFHMKTTIKVFLKTVPCLFLTWSGAASGSSLTDINLTEKEPSCLQSFTSITPPKEPHQEPSIGAKAIIAIPPKTNEVQKLKNAGFNSAYIRGSDEASEWIAVSAQIREQGLSASEHHIDYLADKMFGHIQFMKEGVKTTEEKEKLAKLTDHITKTIKEGRFTYEEYLRACHSLAGIFYPDLDFMNAMNAPENIEELIHVFPKKIAFATNIGAMGIMALNKAGSHNIHALGLVKRHKLKFVQLEFFQHDLGHAVDSRHPPSPRFYNTLRKKTENLSLKKRKHIELGYWLLTHEINLIPTSLNSNWFPSPEAAKAALERILYDFVPENNELKGLIDVSNETAFEENTKQVIEDFYEFMLREPQIFQLKEP